MPREARARRRSRTIRHSPVSALTTLSSRRPFWGLYHVVRFLAEPEKPRGLPAPAPGPKDRWAPLTTDY